MGKKERWFPNDPIMPINANWRATRNQVFDRDGSKCVYCGKLASEVHHKFTKKEARHDRSIQILRDKMEYLVSVCRGCHLKRNGKLCSWLTVMEYIEKVNKASGVGTIQLLE